MIRIYDSIYRHTVVFFVEPIIICMNRYKDRALCSQIIYCRTDQNFLTDRQMVREANNCKQIEGISAPVSRAQHVLPRRRATVPILKYTWIDFVSDFPSGLEEAAPLTALLLVRIRSSFGTTRRVASVHSRLSHKLRRELGKRRMPRLLRYVTQVSGVPSNPRARIQKSPELQIISASP